MQIIDIKSGSPYATTPLQMGGYELLVKEGVDKDGKRFWDREDKTAFEIMLYHPTYKFAGTIDMIIDDGSLKFEVYAVYLKPNGKYNLINYAKELRKNRQIFLAFLTTYKFRLENNV